MKVRVTEVDVARKRIGLTMKLGDAPAGSRQAPGGKPRENRENKFEGARPGQHRGGDRQDSPKAVAPGAMQSAFAKLAGLKK